MGQWFQKTKTPTTPPQSAQPPKTQQPIPQVMPVPPHAVQQLEQRIKRLEELLLRLTEKTPEIRVEALHIHQPVLENLTFRLDQLDIKELSGSLNLGNNFGAKPDHKEETTVWNKATGTKSEPKADSTAAPAKAPVKTDTTAGSTGGAGGKAASANAGAGAPTSPAGGSPGGKIASVTSPGPSAGSAGGSSAASGFSVVSAKELTAETSSAATDPVTGYYAGRSPKRDLTAPASEGSTERTATGYRYTPQPKSTGGA
ncbi:hypothetical protein [Paenibacillus aestuarii]|uniref:Uncharacterized protein n=1 Tax=Paenibacillus aestuarii TaxID=516965 RepID=A0ABW0K8T1_9BACL|nr:hypothetical protein [Paenibacillus aestuarii]